MGDSRDELLARIDRLSAELARGPSRGERRAGWVPEARAGITGWLADIRTNLLEPGDLDPRNLPGASEALRGLDAWGIDVASDDPLTRELLSLAADLQRDR